MTQYLQRHPLTRWMWREYQNEDDGEIRLFFILAQPGEQWRRCNLRW